MSEPFKNSLNNIEKRLEELTDIVTKRQENITRHKQSLRPDSRQSLKLSRKQLQLHQTF